MYKRGTQKELKKKKIHKFTILCDVTLSTSTASRNNADPEQHGNPQSK